MDKDMTKMEQFTIGMFTVINKKLDLISLQIAAPLMLNNSEKREEWKTQIQNVETEIQQTAETLSELMESWED